MRRHHLIEEAKAELDVAYEEVKRAEHTLMDLEFEYNERAKALNGHADPEALAKILGEKDLRQQALSLESLYEMQRRSTQRFALVSACFGIVGSVKDQAMTVDLIERLLFQECELRQNRIAIQRHLRAFQKSLRGYMLEDSNRENDEAVRSNWGAVEAMLRELGREI